MTPHSADHVRARIVDVRFDTRRVLVDLDDGRTLGAPLSWASRAAELPASQQRRWVLVDHGRGVNWPALGQEEPEGALSLWIIEQDRLYEGALGVLQRAGWDAAALSARDRELVALWRLEADVYNGGFLQFLGNWGQQDLAIARDAAGLIGAQRTHRAVISLQELLGPLIEREDVTSIDDVHRLIAAAAPSDPAARFEELEAELTEAMEQELVRCVVTAYGPAPSEA
ncbi:MULTISPECIES: DUF4375 domain-containing protein [Microbacterium]|uniref:DMP19 family protein n=1 Tax=Microbacterium TaxID=33882 RepID=UPI001E54AE58|nr:DUF2442 domain-containing protein [Microbacterium nymphoidis]MCD2496790.1 DUF4375 domain-containing protein [Microbacterium nymphoidis]